MKSSQYVGRKKYDFKNNHYLPVLTYDIITHLQVGSSWSAVVDKCCRGHYQPLLLLYTNPDAEPICTDTAPQKTVIIKENKFLNNNDDSGEWRLSMTIVHKIFSYIKVL